MLAFAAVGLVGCHASPDDARGQAGELANPVRRENAVLNLQRLYAKALADHDGNRKSAAVAAIADASVVPLTKTYVGHPEDRRNGLRILQLLAEMRDPRSVPALVAALDWRSQVSEQHAVLAAQTLENTDIPADERAKVAEALVAALGKIHLSRPIDAQMRTEMIRALGKVGDASPVDSPARQAAVKALSELAVSNVPGVGFEERRLAAHELGIIASPRSIPALIECLFAFDPRQPSRLMRGVAAEGLVRIGRPALDPLLAVLAGKDPAATDAARRYLAALNARHANALSRLTPDQVQGLAATYALGALGLPAALDPLMRETEADDPHRKLNAAVALVRLNLPASDRQRVRDALTRVYKELGSVAGSEGVQMRNQLLVAMTHTYDDALVPFFLAQARDTKLPPQLRLSAFDSAALLADRNEAKQMRAIITSEPKSEDGGYRESFEKSAPMLDAAEACDNELSCWIDKLGSTDEGVARKAAYMVARDGRGDAKAVAALVDHLDDPKISVRLAVVTALDHVAVDGSPAAVQKIDAMHRDEAGRALWAQFSGEALPTAARLRARSSSER
ncbi:MAG: hypothetical protein KC543_09435 [Myxococcales bacterium]|nr:hypothetical protein [Myxococcales bacterium]